MQNSETAAGWAPELGAHRLIASGTTVAMLAPDATVRWWCAPSFDDSPLCWQLLDRDGGCAGFPDLEFVDSDDAPAGATAQTLLRAPFGIVEVRDGLLPYGSGVALVRLLRLVPRAGLPVPTSGQVEHHTVLGVFGGGDAQLVLDGDTVFGRHRSRGEEHRVVLRADAARLHGSRAVSSVTVSADRWSALVVAVGCDPGRDAEDLLERLDRREQAERARLHSSRLPQHHPARALDALAVIRACTFAPTGSVVAAPTTSLPEAPGHDRQFDYRYTWLRDASLSTAVAALLGQPDDARRYLDFVHEAWGGTELLTRPLLDVRGGAVPEEVEVDHVSGWAGSRPIRIGNGAADQRQYDAVGLLAEAVSVYLQVGGTLDGRTWSLVSRLADQTAADDPGSAQLSNGIWELREPRLLVDGDIGRWLVLDRALWIARGWRPWTQRRRWKRARDVIARRVVDAICDDGMLPQSYDGDPVQPDAASLMAVAFGLLRQGDPRASRLVDAVLGRLGAGPFVHRYPPGGDDGFAGVEGAFLPMSFLAVTALARVGRVEEATRRLDRLCADLPRLLAEEVEPQTGRLLGNTPLVWSHAELARALYVLDAACRRDRWGMPAMWAWRLARYTSLRAQQVTSRRDDDPPRSEEDT